MVAFFIAGSILSSFSASAADDDRVSFCHLGERVDANNIVVHNTDIVPIKDMDTNFIAMRTYGEALGMKVDDYIATAYTQCEFGTLAEMTHLRNRPTGRYGDNGPTVTYVPIKMPPAWPAADWLAPSLAALKAKGKVVSTPPSAKPAQRYGITVGSARDKPLVKPATAPATKRVDTVKSTTTAQPAAKRKPPAGPCGRKGQRACTAKQE